MTTIRKGQSVKFYVRVSTEFVKLLDKEKSCSVSINTQTIDASTKEDTNPEYENPEFDFVSGSATVEGNANDYLELRRLLTGMQSGVVGHGDPQDDWIVKDAQGNSMFGGSEYVLSSLDIDMPAEGLATVSVGVEMYNGIA